jgi:hypothetical protein
MGETMAEARMRVSCTNGSGVFLKTQLGCPQLSPNANPVFFDLWAAAPVASDLELRYGNLDPAMAAGIPTSLACRFVWNRNCRTIINYETSIDPLWSLPRTDTATGTLDYTCTVCHNNKDAATAPMVPAGQLDLSAGVRQDNPDRFKSYQDLLVQDDVQWQLVGGALTPVTQDIQLVVNGVPQFQTMVDPVTGLTVQVLDAMGNPIPIMVTVNVPANEPPSMSVNGARASSRFFDRFTTPGIGTVEHMGLLSPAELRLLYEWLDIGAQYFNNTFDAP